MKATGSSETQNKIREIIKRDKTAGPKPISIKKYQKRGTTKKTDTDLPTKTKRRGKKLALLLEIKALRGLQLATRGPEDLKNIKEEISKKQKLLNQFRRKHRTRKQWSTTNTIKTDDK